MNTTPTIKRRNVFSFLKKANNHIEDKVVSYQSLRVASDLSNEERNELLDTDTQPIQIILPTITEEAERIMDEAYNQKEEASVNSPSEINLIPKMHRQSRSSIVQRLATALIFIPSLVFIASFITLFIMFPIDNLDQLPVAAARALIPTIVISLLWLSISIPIGILRNLKLRNYCSKLASGFNARYGLTLNNAQVYDLVNDFRIPVNIDDVRHEVYLSCLDRGWDARLVIRDTGVELPVRKNY